MYARKAKGPQFFTPENQARLIVVANRTEARFFERLRVDDRMQPLKTMNHPEGRLYNQQLKEGKPGRSFASWARSRIRHAVGGELSARRQEELSFARLIAQELRAARAKGNYHELVIVADPHFLGVIMSCLDRVTKKLVKGSVEKNLSHFDEKEVGDYVHAYLNSQPDLGSLIKQPTW